MSDQPQQPSACLVKTIVRPLSYQALDPTIGGFIYAIPITAEQILEFMCQVGVSNHPDAAAARYKEISEHDAPLTLFPDERELSSIIISPLRNAKAAFMTGNHTAVVALAGAVGEALADLTFRIHNPQVAGESMSSQTEAQLFGMGFAKLGQSRRIDVLLGLRIVSAEAARRLQELNRLRNLYLHPAKREDRTPRQDALTAYAHAVWLAADVVGREVRDGAWGLRTPIYKHLKNLGLIVDAPASGPAPDGGASLPAP